MSKLSHVPGRRSGTTLIEVLIASVILAAIMFMALMVMMNASNTTSEATITGDLEYRGRNTLERLRVQFMTGRFRALSNNVELYGLHQNNTFIWFQIPVNSQYSGGLRYGYSTAIGLNHEAAYGKSCVLRFEAEKVIRESNAAPTTAQAAPGPATELPALPVLEEDQIRDIDVNRDGDLLDTFVKGRIMQYVVDTEPNLFALLEESVFVENVVLAVSSSGLFNGDVDNKTTTSDLLFSYLDQAGAPHINAFPHPQARTIAINIWLGAYANDGKSFHLRRSSEVIRLKNVQY